MLGQWVEGCLGGNINDAPFLMDSPDIAKSTISSPSLQRSLPGVTTFVDQFGEPLLSPSSHNDLSRDHVCSLSSSPAVRASPQRRHACQWGVPEMYCIHTPHSEAVRVGTMVETAEASAGLSTIHSSPSSSGSVSSSPFYEPLHHSWSPSACGTTQRLLPQASPELASTRRELWRTLNDAAGVGMTCPMVDWSIPSSSSWVSMANARPISITTSALLRSPSPMSSSRGVSSLTPKRTCNSDLPATWSLTPQRHGLGCRHRTPTHRRSPHDVPTPCTPTAELLFASPATKGSSSSSYAKVELASQKDGALRSIADNLVDIPPLLPSPSRQDSLTSPRALPSKKLGMDAFRNALRAADGLNSSLRQDLLKLVDHFDDCPQTGPVKQSVGITSLWDGLDANKSVTEGWGESYGNCGSASPTQSDVEAALFGMDSPASTPRSYDQSFQSGRGASTREQELADLSLLDSTPIALQSRRSAMWLPQVVGSEALTPDVEEGSRHQRDTSLATARDKFKLSIGASERSRQFRSAVLSELRTLASP